MATSRHGRAGHHPASAGWILVLEKAGLYQGMVGPFPSAGEAEAWATAMFDGKPIWSWRGEPVVSPASLPDAGPGNGTTRRPQLTVVR